MAKRSLEIIMKDLNNITEKFNEKKIDNYENITRQKILFNELKKEHWNELSKKQRLMVNATLKMINVSNIIMKTGGKFIPK